MPTDDVRNFTRDEWNKFLAVPHLSKIDYRFMFKLIRVFFLGEKNTVIAGNKVRRTTVVFFSIINSTNSKI